MNNCIPICRFTRGFGGALLLSQEREVNAPFETIDDHYEMRDVLHPLMAGALEEQFAALLLDGRRKPLAFVRIATGDAVSVLASARRVLAAALLLPRVAHVVTVHNHVVADAEPSEADLDCFADMREKLNVFGLCYLDNVILSHQGEGFFSFRDSGHFEEGAPLVRAA